MQQFDIAILGGGLVGASFAHAMAKSPYKIALIDQHSMDFLYHSSLDNRGLAISITSQQALHELKIWDLLTHRAHAIENVHVSEQGSFGFARLTSQSQRLSALGYVVSASHLGHAVSVGLPDVSNLSILRPEVVHAANFCEQSGSWILSLSKQQISCQLLVAADGINSMMREIEGIGLIEKHSDQSAIVANVHITAQRLTTAYERFTRFGVLAMLPFGSGVVKCVVTGANNICDQIMDKTNMQFLELLQDCMGYRLGKFYTVTERKRFPITCAYAQRLFGRSLIILGNAANSLHPVAAQGFNLGIRDALTLASILLKTNPVAIDTQGIAQNYANLRTADHIRTREFTNSLVEIFNHESRLVGAMRKLGLVASEFIPGLKAKFIDQGLGKWI